MRAPESRKGKEKKMEESGRGERGGGAPCGKFLDEVFTIL